MPPRKRLSMKIPAVAIPQYTPSIGSYREQRLSESRRPFTLWYGNETPTYRHSIGGYHQHNHFDSCIIWHFMAARTIALHWVFPFKELPTKVKRGRNFGQKTVASFHGMTGHYAKIVLKDKRTDITDGLWAERCSEIVSNVRSLIRPAGARAVKLYKKGNVVKSFVRELGRRLGHKGGGSRSGSYLLRAPSAMIRPGGAARDV
ncbi:hypothetical protein EVAR_36484_1 [Eumeta japonica]|uniref:Uncharacterized protein n=1 Tax=Eumeta variegata TaxID=151549 RepID=A0A4C1WSA8_EUMVA|nr:hypothetical protein EVAR_36484_1 [Eumeta japonica]